MALQVKQKSTSVLENLPVVREINSSVSKANCYGRKGTTPNPRYEYSQAIDILLCYDAMSHPMLLDGCITQGAIFMKSSLFGVACAVASSDSSYTSGCLIMSRNIHHCTYKSSVSKVISSYEHRD
ncbi:uncharacterized protein [Palaemon carinicauda]|uniref:uncharacterized protein isoform X2 n=1 Tax=Palaemon carinicauda TaxID=392227 RepID=UPI0035B6A659